MSSEKPPPGFPDIEAKLAKPVKQSAFERAKAEAEAKRKRDEAETAAVYEEFVRSFEQDDDEGSRRGGFQGAPQRTRNHFGGPPPSSSLATGKRHFAMTGSKKSGPGTLGPVPTSYGTKRSFNEYSGEQRGRLAGTYQDAVSGSMSVSEAFNHASDDEDDLQRDAMERAELKAIAKAQLMLSNMPPGTSPAAIKALIPDTLTVDAVRIEPPTGPGSEKKRINAVVTLSRESPGSALDAAISTLHNRYLGCGFYLSVHRHLSSAVSNTLSTLPSSSSAAQPFGAKRAEQKPAPHKLSGPHGYRGGFAPPSSYHQAGSGSRSSRFYVPATAPDDIRTLRLIHKTVERVLEYGHDFEALLMSRPQVQREEKWAWLWDSTSAGGIWYRWRLWVLTTGYKIRPKREPQVGIFEDSSPWQVPDPLAFEFVSQLDEFVSDAEYNSSDDEDMDRDAPRENNVGEVERPFLTPLEKAKLVHLLARLPVSLTKIRKGDVARVTAFALMHADRGPGEVVDLIVSNIGKPFAFTSAGGEKKNKENKEARQATGTEDGSAMEGPDTSAGSLIGLYVVSDILSSSSTTVFRHAWRFRGQFEKALKDYQVFEFLGTMPEKNGWGRLRAEKWKRSIGLVLNLWEGWCVFPGKAHEQFVSAFEKPPPIKTDETSIKGKSTLPEAPTALKEAAMPGKVEENVKEQQKDEVMKDKDDDDDDDVRGEPIGDDEDEIMGDSLNDDDIMKALMGGRGGSAQCEGSETAANQDASENGRGRKRMRAVDMFAESDGSEGQ
ncbi:hypothetical protein CP533_4528 [Ophiocordyceps camponoti-saundersi (nom. inval.)]|nr:hypothetical protein CP533_4528 [Ophiocordyceps camponoti-saundersi (nom. inval.)]